jgi:hypothetical protein
MNEIQPIFFDREDLLAYYFSAGYVAIIVAGGCDGMMVGGMLNFVCQWTYRLAAEHGQALLDAQSQLLFKPM